MLNAYVGLASRNGLAALRPERQDTLAWAHQSAAGASGPLAVAFWAVLPDHDAARISWLLARGERSDALRELGRSAREIGSILPGDSPLRH